MSDIFIGYRRQDSDAYAGRLYDRLAARFDKVQIFMDIDMDLGVDFVREIEQRVGSCKVLVAVIGRGWLKDGEGRRRLDDPNDWVRLEIVAALERDIPVIPALVGGAKMPAASDLPDALSKLKRRQAIEITHGGFHSDVDRLIQGLEKLVPATKSKTKKAAASKDGSTEPESDPTVEIPEGVYFDPQTRLMWTIDDNGQPVTWDKANDYARRLRLGGYYWRLPTTEELSNLREHTPHLFRLSNWVVWGLGGGKSGADVWRYNWLNGSGQGRRLKDLEFSSSDLAVVLCVRRPGA